MGKISRPRVFLIVRAAKQNVTKTLILEALAQDVRAQRTLAELLDPIIRAAVFRACRARRRCSDVDDIAQQVWVRILRDDGRALRSFDPERGSAVAYFRLIAQRVAADHMMRRNHDLLSAEELDAHPAHETDVETRAIARDRVEKIAARVREKLPARTQSVFVLFAAEEAPKDIAETLHLQSRIVHNAIFKIRSVARGFDASEPRAA
jgi:RNA polymerase sigma factor (sigma-70 family)